MAILAEMKATIDRAVQSPDEFTVRLSEVWEEIGYSRYADTVRAMKSKLVEAEDYVQCDAHSCASGFRNPNPLIEYLLCGDSFKHLCLMAETENGRELRRYYIQVEKEYRRMMTASLTRTPIDNTALYQQLGSQSQEIDRLKEQVKALQVDRANLRSVSGSLYAERPDSKTMVYNLAQVRAIIGYSDEAYTFKVIMECLKKVRDYKILCSIPGKEDLMITEAALQELAIVARSSRGCRTDRLPELLVVERSRLFQEPIGKANTRHGQAFS